MSEQRSGHESGRGHGPGGRLWPMKGDRIELRRPLTNDPPWDLVEVLHIVPNWAHWAQLAGPGYVVPRFLESHQHLWRWPHRLAPPTQPPTP